MMDGSRGKNTADRTGHTSNGPRVVAVCGSLREGSYTRLALNHALAAAAGHGGRTDLLDLRQFELSPYDPSGDNDDDAAELTDRIRRADAVILGTPVYHGSYSSPLKAAIDHCGFDEFENTTVGLLAVSGGNGSYTGAINHLNIVARTLHAWVLPHQIGIGSPGDQFDSQGALINDALAARVAALGQKAVSYARISSTLTCSTHEKGVSTEN